MSSTYKKIPVQDVVNAHPEAELLRRILHETRPISELLDAGCYIAGGFGRAVMNGGDVRRYLGIPGKDQIRGHYGDIDIFFEDPARADEYRDIFKSEFRSLGKNALEKVINGSIRVQLVDGEKLIKPPEEQMDRFDFTNACVSITRDHVIVHERFEELERDHALDVKQCHSPFLGSRIMKYFTTRGLKSVTPESEPVITEWIMRALSVNFDIATQVKIDSNALNHSVQRILGESRLTRADDLLLVLGRFKATQREKYGLVREVDFALANLKERGYEISIPTA